MTANPRFGHQHFIASTLAKNRRVLKMIEQINPACDLEVDGGIDPKTAPSVGGAGTNALVPGTSIFGDGQRAPTTVKRLQTAANSVATQTKE